MATVPQDNTRESRDSLTGLADLEEARATIARWQRDWPRDTIPCPIHAMMITLGPSDAQFLERREVCPAEGLLVLFPSWLSHSVTRLGDASAGERIAVAFNVHGAEV